MTFLNHKRIIASSISNTPTELVSTTKPHFLMIVVNSFLCCSIFLFFKAKIYPSEVIINVTKRNYFPYYKISNYTVPWI